MRYSGKEADTRHNKVGVCELNGDRCIIMERERDRFVDCRTCVVPVVYMLARLDR